MVVRIVDTIGESGCGESCKAVLAVPPIAPGAFPMLGATEPGFHFTATAKNFDHYFPACLANGFFTIAAPLRGTDATASHVVGLMNSTPAGVFRLAAIPRWEETNYFDSGSWLNKSSVTTQTFSGCRQTLGMKSLFAPHTSALRDLTPGANDMIPALLPTVAAKLGDENEADKQLRIGIGGFLKPPFAAIRRDKPNSPARF
jgi:hypothetical protein